MCGKVPKHTFAWGAYFHFHKKEAAITRIRHRQNISRHTCVQRRYVYVYVYMYKCKGDVKEDVSWDVSSDESSMLGRCLRL